MPIITTSTKTIEQRIRKLVRLRRALLAAAALCFGAAAANIPGAQHGHTLNLIAGLLALLSSITSLALAGHLRATVYAIERSRRIVFRHINNGR